MFIRLVCLASMVLVSATAVDAQTFENTGFITIPEHGEGTPYPSSIEVSGLSGRIESITVSLFGLEHTAPRYFKVLLVGPGGETVLLMSDTGSTVSISNVDLTFEDGARLCRIFRR